MNLPTMPLIIATGRKMITRLSVVASTASPISRVPCNRRLHRRQLLLFHEAEDVLEHDDRVVDDDADHQHQRQHRDLVQREAHRVHQRVGRDDRRRNRDGGDERGAPVPNEQQHDQRGEEAAQIRCSWTAWNDSEINFDWSRV